MRHPCARPSVIDETTTAEDVSLMGIGRIDFHGLRDAHRQRGDQLVHAISQTFADDPLAGPAVSDLEQQCAGWLSGRYVAAVASGTDALTLSLKACGIGSGDEVIVPSFSFIASASAVLNAGATPIYVPINPDSLHMLPEAIGAAGTQATKAAIAVHLFGRCHENIRELADQCAHLGLWLIEDAAQAFGASIDQQPAGTFGQIAAFSLDPTKVLGGITTGGLVATDRPDLHQAISQMRSHGYNPATQRFERLGINSRMSSANAAVVVANLGHQTAWRSKRRQIATTYAEALSENPHIQSITPSSSGANAVDNHHKFVIRTAEREHLRRWLAVHDIPTKIHYARALPDHPALSTLARVTGDLHAARRAASQVLSLPIHPNLRLDQVNYISRVLRDYAR